MPLVLALCHAECGWAPPLLQRVRPLTADRGGARRSSVALAASDAAPFTFEVDCDLGEGGGVVSLSCTPYFSSSELLTFRYPLPFELEAEQVAGAVKVRLAHPLLTACALQRRAATHMSRAGGQGWARPAGGRHPPRLFHV